MARRVRAVAARRKDERAYTEALRRAFFAPLFRAIEPVVDEPGPASADIFLSRLERVDVPEDVVEPYFVALERYQFGRFVASFKSAGGVDVRGFVVRQLPDELGSPRVRRLLRERIDENVRLIGNVSERTHVRLRGRIGTAVRKAARITGPGPIPADQFKSLVRLAVEKEKRTTMSNVRLIARDQTTKTIGALNEIRQTDAGITHYVWTTQGDDRVRPEHQSLNGRTFEWASPPPIGPPGQPILCRCVASPVVPPAWWESHLG